MSYGQQPNYGGPPNQPPYGQPGYPPPQPPPRRSSAPAVFGVMIVLFGGCAWRVAASKHQTACIYTPTYCSAASRLTREDWTTLKAAPTTEPEIPYDTQQRHKQAQAKFDELAKRQAMNRDWVTAPTTTYEFGLRKAAAQCSDELKSGEDILTRAGKAAAAEDTTTLDATYVEYDAHAKKVAALQNQLEALCK